MIPDPSPADAYEAYWAALDPEPVCVTTEPVPDDAYEAFLALDE